MSHWLLRLSLSGRGAAVCCWTWEWSLSYFWAGKGAETRKKKERHSLFLQGNINLIYSSQNDESQHSRNSNCGTRIHHGAFVAFVPVTLVFSIPEAPQVGCEKKSGEFACFWEPCW